MENIQKSFFIYLKLLYKKWTLWIFLALDFLALAVDLIYPQFQIPPVTYWLLALFGLVWASFRVYLDIVPKEHHTPPKLTLEFIEGNEYMYSLTPFPLHEDEEILPRAEITFHLRIQNQSPTPVRILRVEGEFLSDATRGNSKKTETKMFSGSFALAYAQVIGLNESSYPITLDAYKIVIYDLLSQLSFSPYFNPAQFAARLARIPLKALNPIVTVRAEAQSVADGTIHHFKMQHEVSLHPLKDLYTNLWQEKGKKDLLDIINAA